MTGFSVPSLLRLLVLIAIVAFLGLWSGAEVAAGAGPSPITGVQTSTGKVVAFDGSSVTIDTAGNGSRVLAALDAAAGTVTRADYPYVWGGGHAAAGAASIGIRGPGYNGRRSGFDCSGAVAAVLSGAGLWPAGAGVPSDSGVISTLRADKLIQRGVGVGADEVTLYDDPGVHIFMNIAGRFFGTSDGYGASSTQKRGGAGWLDDGAPDASSRAFHPYHFVSRITGNQPSQLTVGLGTQAGPADVFLPGDRLKIQWQELASGGMLADAILLSGAQQVSGSVSSVGAGGQSVVLSTPSGQTLTLSVPSSVSVPAGAEMLGSLTAGEQVTLTFTRAGATLLARSAEVTGTAPYGAPTPPGPGLTVPAQPTGGAAAG